MGTFSRYIFRQAAGALLLILLSLTGIVWIALALRELNVVTSSGQDALILVEMTTLALPNLIAMIAPFALLIGVVHTLNRLGGDSELIVFSAGGATIWALARPLLLLALLVSAGIALVNHLVMPWSLRQLRDIVVQVRTDLLTQVIQPGRFSSPENGLTFHIRERALNGELLDLVMHDMRKAKQSNSYLAERGLIVKQDDDAYLVMFDGHVIQRENPSDSPQILSFDKYAVDLDRFEQRTGETMTLRPRERYTFELMGPEQLAGISPRNLGHYTAEFHERFANPLYPIVFVLIALAAIGKAQSTRQNRTERMVIGVAVAAGSRLGGLAFNNLAVLHASAIPVLYLIPISAMCLALLALSRRTLPKGGPKLIESTLDRLAGLGGWLGLGSRGTVPALGRGGGS